MKVETGEQHEIKPLQEPSQCNKPTQELPQLNEMKKSTSPPTVTDAVSVTDDSNSVKSADGNSQQDGEDCSTDKNERGSIPLDSDKSIESSNDAMPMRTPSTAEMPEHSVEVTNDESSTNLPLNTSGTGDNETKILPQSTEVTEEEVKDDANYHDYSRTPNDKSVELGNALAAVASGKEPPFPVKLHRILSNAEHNDVISWLPHGRSWRVLKPKAFEEKVIPMYFRHAKYASFMRQVNGWGFKRMTQGPDHNSYYNELFLRGLPHLCAKMRRPAKAKTGTTDSDTNPDFYRISMVNPLPSSNPIPGNLAALNIAGVNGFPNFSGLPTHGLTSQEQGSAQPVAVALGNMHLPGGNIGINTMATDASNTNFLLQQQLQGQLSQYTDPGQLNLQQSLASGNYNLMLNNSGADANQLDPARIRREAIARQLGISPPDKAVDMSAIINANMNNLAAANMLQAGLNVNSSNFNGNPLSLPGVGNIPINQLQLQQMIPNYATGVNQNQLLQTLGLMGLGTGQLNNVALNNLNAQILLSQHSQGVNNAGISPAQKMDAFGNIGGLVTPNQLIQQQQIQTQQFAAAQAQKIESNNSKETNVGKPDSENCNGNDGNGNGN